MSSNQINKNIRNKNDDKKKETRTQNICENT